MLAISSSRLLCFSAMLSHGIATRQSFGLFSTIGHSNLSYSPLHTPVRLKASHIRIANRKRVEMFVGKRFHLPTRLKTAAPDIAAEWDYDKNPMHIYPEIVGIGNVEHVWWRCSVCSHSYRMSVEKRVVRGGGCDLCIATEKRNTMNQVTTNDAHHSDAEEEYSHDRDQCPQLLEGEMDPSLRPKRSTVFNIRTKY